MLWIFRDSDAPSLDYGVEQALDRIDAPLAVSWSRWVLDLVTDAQNPTPRPIYRNLDGARIPVGNTPQYTFYGWDKQQRCWVAFLDVECPDARLPKALEQNLWRNRNRGTRVVEEDRLAREEMQRYAHESRVDDQNHWAAENLSYFRDAIEGSRGLVHDSGMLGFKTPKTYSSRYISRRRDRQDEAMQMSLRERGLTPHPSGREY